MRRRPHAWRDDDELVRLAREGDREALSILLDRYYDRIWAIARRMMVNHHDAEDATQQALIAVARGIGRFDGRAAISTWMHRVAVNACLDELRRRQRTPRPLDEVPETEPRHSSGPDPATAIVERDAIDAAMSDLAPEFRAAVVLRDVCDLDYDEIAEILAVPGGTVRSRIARGRRVLRTQLGDAGNSNGRELVEESEP